MALIVETGSVVPNAESYISVAEANTYHSDRGNSTWTSLLDPEKEQAIRRAMDYLAQEYGERWKGYRVAVAQPLDWPRSSMVSRGVTIEQNVIPKLLKNAVAELAWRAAAKVQLIKDVSPEDRVKREKIGPLETEYFDSGFYKIKYPAIDALLSSFVSSSGDGVNVKLVRT
jgi:hypothetical protein